MEYLTLEKKYSEHTVKAYKADITSFVVFYKNEYGESDVVKSNYSQIRSWIVFLVDTGVSNRTINRKVSSLKTYYKFLVKIECVDKNPLSGHKALKVSKKIQLPFSELEVSQVLRELKEACDFVSVRNRLIVELFYATGMRRGELVNLKLADVDIYNAQVKVLGKRNKERYIPLIPSVVETLKLYLSKRSEVFDLSLIHI